MSISVLSGSEIVVSGTDIFHLLFELLILFVCFFSFYVLRKSVAYVITLNFSAGIFSFLATICGMRDPSSLCRDQTHAPLHWECRILPTVPLGSSNAEDLFQRKSRQERKLFKIFTILTHFQRRKSSSSSTIRQVKYSK